MPFNISVLNDFFQFREIRVREAQMRQLAKRSLLLESCHEKVWTFQFQPLIRAYIQHRTLEHHRRTNDHWGEANCLKAIGDVLQFQDDREAALNSYEQAIALFRGVGSKLGEANCLQAIGDVLQFQKDMVAALNSYEQAIALFRGVGARLGEANVLGSLGDLYFAEEQYERALELQQQRLWIMQEIRDRYSQAASLYYLARTLVQLNHIEAAILSYEAARDIFQDLGLDDLANLCQRCIDEQQQG